MERASFEKFLNDLDKGVYNFTKNGKCIKCGNCCTALLPVSKAEIKILQRYVKKHRIQKENHADVDLDLTCPFYDTKKKLCKVYEVRPMICRDFICSKMQKDIEISKQRFSFDNRYSVVNMREIF